MVTKEVGEAIGGLKKLVPTGTCVLIEGLLAETPEGTKQVRADTAGHSRRVQLQQLLAAAVLVIGILSIRQLEEYLPQAEAISCVVGSSSSSSIAQ
jgi:hypothetical protein